MVITDEILLSKQLCLKFLCRALLGHVNALDLSFCCLICLLVYRKVSSRYFHGFVVSWANMDGTVQTFVSIANSWGMQPLKQSDQ
jgi:hypothetical protein